MSSFGEELKRERELRQISLREISEATKINLRYLEALERNDFRHLPGGVFNKGFVRAYAQFVGIDPEAMVNAYLLEEQDQERREDATGQEMLRRRPVATLEEILEAREAPPRSRRGWAVAAVIAIALLALLLWWLWPSGAASRVEPRPAAAESTPPPSEPEAAVPAPTLTESGGGETESGPTAAETPEASPAPAPDHTPEPAPATAAASVSSIDARVRLERATSGRINCDNRRVEILDGMSAGTELRFRCRTFLVVDAADGGAVLIGLSGRTPEPLGADGQAVRGYRVVPAGNGRP